MRLIRAIILGGLVAGTFAAAPAAAQTAVDDLASSWFRWQAPPLPPRRPVRLAYRLPRVMPPAVEPTRTYRSFPVLLGVGF